MVSNVKDSNSVADRTCCSSVAKLHSATVFTVLKEVFTSLLSSDSVWTPKSPFVQPSATHLAQTRTDSHRLQLCPEPMEPMEPIFDSETSSCAWMQSSDLCSLVVSTSGSGQRPTVEIRARWVKVTLGEAVLLDAELGGVLDWVWTGVCR